VQTVLGDALAMTPSRRRMLHRRRKCSLYMVMISQSRDQLERCLRRWGLEPLILDQLPTEGQTVIEKLEAAIAEADLAVVLATPDR